MIYHDVLCFIREGILQTGYFSGPIYEFAVREQQGDVFKPVYYKDGSNFIDVMAFDLNGSGYIRKTGEANFSRSSLPVTVACDGLTGILDLRLPLRAVFAVPKTKLGNDAFSADMLALELIDVLQASIPNNNGLQVVSRVNRYSTDRTAIYNEETNTGIAPILELAYISIDFELTFTGSAECFKQECTPYYG